MAPQVPVGEPSALQAGVTWSWKRVEHSDFPVADSWVYTYYLTGKTSLSFAATNALTTHDFSVTVTAATTGAVAAGNYKWQLRASLAGAVYLVDEGEFVVEADTAVSAASDQRTFAEKQLALVESEIQARVDGTGSANEGYTIGTRQITKIPIKELHTLRAWYAAEVQRQRLNGRLAPYRFWSVRP